MGHRTAGDKMLEAYLVEHGYDVPEHEPDLGIGVRIEYRLERDGDACLTEVKEFAVGSNPIKRSGTYSQEQILKPIRGQIHEAARKLKKAMAFQLPLVVVLTDPSGALSGFLRPAEVIAAMEGDLSVQVPVAPSGPVGPATLISGMNGELRHDHPYISAVVVIHEALVGRHHAHAFVTRSPGAVALSPAFFRGEDDLVFEFSDEAGKYLLRERAQS